jgi:hypothetical protein
MTKINDGGPAFPQHDLSGYGMGPSMRGQTDEAYSGKYTVEGMTLRQWYAGQALAGHLASMNPGSFSHEECNHVAEQCVWLADALIANFAAREPKP